MTVHPFLGSLFKRDYENAAFSKLYHMLVADGRNMDIVLIGNVLCGGCELDALVIRDKAIVIVDFKNHGGRIRISENDEWFNLDARVSVGGGMRANPMIQLRHYRQTLMGVCKKNGLLSQFDDPTHISGLVLFQKPIELVGEFPRGYRWLGVRDYQTAGDWLARQNSNYINVSNARMRKFISHLGVHRISAEGIGTVKLFNPAGSISPKLTSSAMVSQADVQAYLRKAALRAMYGSDSEYPEEMREPNIGLIRDVIRQTKISQADQLVRHHQYQDVPSPSVADVDLETSGRDDLEVENGPPFLRKAPSIMTAYRGR